MVVAICKNKYKDHNGKVKDYYLVDLDGNGSIVTALQIKNAIKAGKIKILNMELSDSGRLTERELSKAELVLLDTLKAFNDLENTDIYKGDYVYCMEHIQRQIGKYFGFNPWR